MTITYDTYSPEGVSTGVIPKEYVATLGGETYKYASPMSGGKPRSKKTLRRRRTATLRKKNRKTRARKSRNHSPKSIQLHPW